MSFDAAVAPTIDGFLFRPVREGLWKQHETWDGTYTVDDLLDIHEMLDLRDENDLRARKAVNG